MLLSFFFSLILGLQSLFAPQPSVNAESYHILFIQGTIQNKNTGATLKRGDKLTTTDKVVFKSKDAKAVVLSTTRGRFVLAAKSNANSELADFVSNVVSPLKTNSKLSTRGGADDQNGIQDLKAHFGKATDESNVPNFAIIGEEYSFKVDVSKYKMNEQKFLSIFIQTMSGKKTLRAVRHEGNIATLSKAGSFKNIDLADVKLVEMHQYDKANGFPESTVLASFKPIFINSDDLKASFHEYLSMTAENIDEVLRTYMAGDKEANEKIAKMSEKDKRRELLYFFIQECYGQHSEEGSIDVNKIKVDEPTMDKWLKTNGFVS